MMVKYTLVVVGTDFGIGDFLQTLYRRYPYFISGTAKREPGRYEAQMHFSKNVNDEQLKQFLEQTHPYVDIDAQGKEIHLCAKAGACCCEESERL
jgi:hypothetical protein